MDCQDDLTKYEHQFRSLQQPCGSSLSQIKSYASKFTPLALIKWFDIQLLIDFHIF